MVTIDQGPPSFFKRGPTPLAQLSFYVILSLALIVLDARFHYLDRVRQALSIAVHPLQEAVHVPVRSLSRSGNYVRNLEELQEENHRLKRERLADAPDLLRLKQLEEENARLRRLLAVKERERASGQVAQILYTVRDPFSRHIVVNKGMTDGIGAGQPVVDDTGIIGQVTRVYPFVSEITLITDKDQSLPVQIVRTGMRSVIFGLGDGRLEIRFLPLNADVQEGDLVVTSGLDGVFLPGFPVARVERVERDNAYSFARIVCAPLAGVENFNEVMILAPRKEIAPPPEPETMVEGAPEEKKPARKKPRPKAVSRNNP